MQSDNPPSSSRVILLGASNLTRAISTVVGTAQAMLGSPLELLIAMGHGRSFGRASRVLGRTLPGIDECGLWDSLKDAPQAPTYALITDIGNDIVYGYDIALIAEWIESTLTRLKDLKARTVITRLPVQSIEALSALRYHMAKAILFPGRSLSLDEAKRRVREIDSAINMLAARHGATPVELPGDWYGLDPVHLSRSQHAAAFAQIMASWSDSNDQPAEASGSLARWLKLHLARPQQWGLLGVPLGSTQPAVYLGDGSSVALY